MKKIKAKVKRYNWKDIGERMLKTFIQGILAYLITSLGSVTDVNEVVIKSLIIGAVASGLSAVMNVIIQELDTKKEVK